MRKAWTRCLQIECHRFLKEKQERSEILDLMNAQETALKHIWNNPEDEVWPEELLGEDDGTLGN
jgi:hypothetical protein